MSELNFEQLYAMIWENPMLGAQTAKEQHQSHRRRQYEFAVLGYALAAKLTVAREWLDDFYALPFFSGTYTPNADNLLLHCVQYLYEDRIGSDSDRAGEHARAMQPLFGAHTHPARVLELLMKGGGFRGLEEGRSLPPAPEPPQQRRLNGLEDSATSGPLNGKTEPGDRTRCPSPSGDLPPKGKKRLKGQRTLMKDVLERYLLIAMDPLESMHSLFSLSVGECRYIQITRLEGKSGELIEFAGKLEP